MSKIQPSDATKALMSGFNAFFLRLPILARRQLPEGTLKAVYMQGFNDGMIFEQNRKEKENKKENENDSSAE